MLPRIAYSAGAGAAALGAVLAGAEQAVLPAPVRVLETRRYAGSFEGDTWQDLQRDLLAAAGSLEQRASPRPDVYATNGSLDLSWNNAELFSYGLLSVKCSECYVKGTAHATLTVEKDFNFTSAAKQFIGEFGGEVVNITKEVWEEFEDWAVFVFENATDTIWDDVQDAVSLKWDDFETLDWDAYAFPTWNVSLDMDLSEMPETKVQLKFDGLELYMLLDVALTADQIWTIPLYPKSWTQPAGLSVGGQELGIVIGLDLILELSAEIDMSTGVHISFDDGLTMEIAMFGSNVSTISLTDGNFEFLPVTVNTSGVAFDATLRLSVKTGLDLSAELGDDVKLGAGASAQVYADLAHFRTNITPSDQSHVLRARDDASYPDGCELPVVETYEFGLGAKAGAYVEFNGDTWGPTPNTSVQIFYTTLMSACAVSAAATPTGSGSQTATTTTTRAKRTDPPQLDGRAGAGAGGGASTSLTLASTPVTYTVTNVLCRSAGLRDCPASLQSTVQATRTSTYYTSLPSGAEITSVPGTTTAGSGVVVGARTFGSGANGIAASSGSPRSYVPPAASSSSSATSGGAGPVQSAIDGVQDGFAGLSDRDRKLVVGLSAGVGGALLLGLVAGITVCYRRRKTASGPQDTQALLVREKGAVDSQPSIPLTPSVTTPSLRSKWPFDSGSDLSVGRYVDERPSYESIASLPRQLLLSKFRREYRRESGDK